MPNDNYSDPLLQCLVIFTKIQGRPFSAEALTAGLPVEEGKSSPTLFSLKRSQGLFSRAAAKAGFKTKISKTGLDDITSLTLPCILLLKSKDSESINACILQKFDETRENAYIILPEMGEVINKVPVQDLAQEYFGLAFFLKREIVYDDKDLDLLRFEGKHWFWGTMKMVTGTYRNVFLASLLINIFVIATPLYTMNVYDRVVPNSATDTLWILSIGVLAIYAIDLTLKFIRSYLLEVAGKKSDIIMSSIIFEKVMDLKMSAMPKSIGSFANVLKEFESIRNFMTSSTITILIDMPFVIIFLVVIYNISGAAVLIPLVTMFAIVIYTTTLRSRIQSSIRNTYKANSSKNGVLIESLSSIETLKTMGATGYAQWKWEEATGNIAEKSIKTKFLTASISSVTSFFVQLNTVSIIIFGVYMIKSNSLTLGGFIATVIISTRAIAPMGQIASLIAQFHHTKTAYTAIDKIMDLPAEHPKGKKFVQRTEFKGHIELRNVNFAYPETDKFALSNVSANISPGEHVGIIGKIGSGKSTIQKLLLGLHYANEGSVYIDGIDIKQLDPAELRKNIAYVPQDITLFSGNVRENLIYRAPHATDEDILRAADISGVSSFVNKHPMGFDMPVGERGSMVSGGQRQSIALARAILLESPIVILDEPTNAMDNTTEAQVIRRLKEHLAGKTIILVTHKTSVLNLVDRIIVMEDGMVAMDGRKEDVVSRLKAKKS